MTLELISRPMTRNVSSVPWSEQEPSAMLAVSEETCAREPHRPQLPRRNRNREAHLASFLAVSPTDDMHKENAMHCTLVTCRPFYRHGPLAPDDRLLEETLTEAGVEVQVKPWEEPWNKVETDLTLVRSTWNYYAHAPAFLAWASSVATCTTLLNPLPILQWNSHKAYLAELERLGFPIIPTIWLPRSRCAHLASLLQ